MRFWSDSVKPPVVSTRSEAWQIGVKPVVTDESEANRAESGESDRFPTKCRSEKVTREDGETSAQMYAAKWFPARSTSTRLPANSPSL
ncbi:hypothetical protein L2E82_34782 [Cichorium intybus]|uniref:Uncharacterized protein n=1 Tax=Cichorium intybus TaxID=13427 RepID=A0ACB9BMN7_CICIN|nr:hypothetical protein L2E82_34782 [Cichorium intybus]